MTTADFIEKTYNTTATRERRCSSVFTDYEGTVYSYGYHYPLAFNVARMDFINTQGYSSTTAKHISWAWRAVGYNSIGVKLWRDEARVIADRYASETDKLRAIESALERELKDINIEMGKKTRTDTQVYAHLSSERSRVMDSLSSVRAELRG